MNQNLSDPKWYSGSLDTGGLPADPAYPSLDHVHAQLRQLAGDHADCLSVQTVGHSVGGQEISLAAITDPAVSNEDKQIAIFFGAEHGCELSATSALLHVLQWLVSPSAAEIRRSHQVLIVPCVNPDGYATLHFHNRNGANLYSDYALQGEPTQPEAHAIWKLLETHQPEVVGSCHGRFHKQSYAVIENCQGAYGSSRYDRCHSRLFAEEVNRACDAAGYPQDRMEEDAERILPWLPGFENHSYRSGDLMTPGVYAYNRFHSLNLSMEIMYDESGLVKLRKILELGNQPWRHNPRPGYPVDTITTTDPYGYGIVAYGTTVAERRRSRVELWQSNDTLTRFFLPTPTDAGGFCCVGFSTTFDDRIARCGTTGDVLALFANDPNVAIDPLRMVCSDQLTAPVEKGAERPAARPNWLAELRHGISLRCRLLPGSRVRRVLINGREAQVSAREGYETYTPPQSFTFVQINIPPRTSIAAPNGKLTRGLCTIEYDPGKVGQRRVD